MTQGHVIVVVGNGSHAHLVLARKPKAEEIYRLKNIIERDKVSETFEEKVRNAALIFGYEDKDWRWMKYELCVVNA